jgi:hypothetical protein
VVFLELVCRVLVIEFIRDVLKYEGCGGELLVMLVELVVVELLLEDRWVGILLGDLIVIVMDIFVNFFKWLFKIFVDFSWIFLVIYNLKIRNFYSFII